MISSRCLYRSLPRVIRQVLSKRIFPIPTGMRKLLTFDSRLSRLPQFPPYSRPVVVIREIYIPHLNFSFSWIFGAKKEGEEDSGVENGRNISRLLRVSSISRGTVAGTDLESNRSCWEGFDENSKNSKNSIDPSTVTGLSHVPSTRLVSLFLSVSR